MKYALVVDAGTGSCRSILFDLDGNAAAQTQREWTYEEETGVDGAVRFDPELFFRIVLDCLRQTVRRAAGAGVNPADILTVCVTSQREGMELDWVQPNEKVGDCAVLLSAGSRVTGGFGKGSCLHASLIKQIVPDIPVALITIRRGAPGVMQGFRDLIAKFGCELLITCDTGADAFFTGTETQVQSPLCDAYSILAASELEIPGVYGVVGFGGDAELPLQDLIKNMGLAMEKGGFLGAHGITQEDLALLEQVLRHIPYEEVEKWPYEAARGHMGIHYCKRLWSVDITPAAAVTFFFDADTMREVNPLIDALRETKTLQEAEEILMKDWNLFAETRLPLVIPAPSAPQVPD